MSDNYYFSLQNINNDKDNEVDTFICGGCKHQFSSLETFITHKEQECHRSITIPIEGTTFSIANIQKEKETSDDTLATNKTLEFEASIIEEKESSKNPLSCTFCKKCFVKKFDLIQHERTHTGERPFQCVICGRAFSQKSNVRKHMDTHKVYPNGKHTLQLTQNEIVSWTYDCQYCSNSFDNYYHYKKHLVEHSDLKVFKCLEKDCCKIFKEVEDYVEHFQSHNITSFSCQICLGTFDNIKDLGKHFQQHKEKSTMTNRSVVCTSCRATFRSMESLKKHEATDNHHHECPQCKSVFKCERFLRRHLSTHWNLFIFTCGMCFKNFRSSISLKRHYSTHFTKRHFECDHCDKSYTTKQLIQRHMLSAHLNVKYKCCFKNICDKTFGRKDKLYAHEVTHSKCLSCRQKKRLCEVCQTKHQSSKIVHNKFRKRLKDSVLENSMQNIEILIIQE